MDRRIFAHAAMGLTGPCSTSTSTAGSLRCRAATRCSSISRACASAPPRTSTTSRSAVEGRCREIGHRVPVVVNYDNFRIDPELVDAYAAMVRHMEDTCYTEVTRYTSSAFLRLKLGDALERAGVKPHLFESAELGTPARPG